MLRADISNFGKYRFDRSRTIDNIFVLLVLFGTFDGNNDDRQNDHDNDNVNTTERPTLWQQPRVADYGCLEICQNQCWWIRVAQTPHGLKTTFVCLPPLHFWQFGCFENGVVKHVGVNFLRSWTRLRVSTVVGCICPPIVRVACFAGCMSSNNPIDFILWCDVGIVGCHIRKCFNMLCIYRFVNYSIFVRFMVYCCRTIVMCCMF